MQGQGRLRPISISATVFGCGWVLMGLEMLGGRMLAPYFGSGVWVWGSVISIFLIALSLGYFLGGIFSQRFPSATALAAVMLLTAAAVVPVALWYSPVAAWWADAGLSEKWGSLAAALSLFFAPSVLLGMVSPYAVHLVTRRVASVGLSAGSLYALSTLGSFLGCLTTAFYLILWMELRSILLLYAGVLVFLACLQTVLWAVAGDPGAGERGARRWSAYGPLLPAGALGVLVAVANWSGIEPSEAGAFSLPVSAPAFGENDTGGSPYLLDEYDDPREMERGEGPEDGDSRTQSAPVHEPAEADGDWHGEKVLFEKESLYHNVRVTESGGIRRLHFRRSGGEHEESAICLKDPLDLQMEHYRYMMAGFAYVPKPRRILFIGLGGGTLSIAIRRYFPDAYIDNVELDPVVALAARKYFGFKTDDRMALYVRDGRVQVRQFIREGRRYDIIMVDAFRGGYIPYHLTTREFMQQLQRALTPGGVVVSNLRPGFASYHYHQRTFAATFRNQRSYGGSSNVIVVADMAARPRTQPELLKAAARLQAEKRFRFDLPALIAEEGADGGFEKKGPILTDAHAPTDVLRSIPDR